MDAFLLCLLGASLVAALIWAKTRYASFLAQVPEDYSTPKGAQIDLRRHLNGPILCEGVIYGPLGRVSSRFVARFDAAWTGNTGVMTEHFTYDDGSEQSREWNLSIGNDGRIRATAPDVIGEGTGQQSGDSMLLQYKIRLPETSGGHVLNAVDWMYLTPNGTIINRSQFRKFGLKVAELVATLRPLDGKAA